MTLNRQVVAAGDVGRGGDAQGVVPHAPQLRSLEDAGLDGCETALRFSRDDRIRAWLSCESPCC